MPRVKRELPGRDPRLLERGGYVTPPELAAYLRKALGTLDQWASKGYGPKSIKVGGGRLYDTEDVKAWLKGLKDEQGARDEERHGHAA